MQDEIAAAKREGAAAERERLAEYAALPDAAFAALDLGKIVEELSLDGQRQFLALAERRGAAKAEALHRRRQGGTPPPVIAGPLPPILPPQARPADRSGEAGAVILSAVAHGAVLAVIGAAAFAAERLFLPEASSRWALVVGAGLAAALLVHWAALMASVSRWVGGALFAIALAAGGWAAVIARAPAPVVVGGHAVVAINAPIWGYYSVAALRAGGDGMVFAAPGQVYEVAAIDGDAVQILVFVQKAHGNLRVWVPRDMLRGAN